MDEDAAGLGFGEEFEESGKEGVILVGMRYRLLDIVGLEIGVADLEVNATG